MKKIIIVIAGIMLVAGICIAESYEELNENQDIIQEEQIDTDYQRYTEEVIDEPTYEDKIDFQEDTYYIESQDNQEIDQETEQDDAQ